MPRCFTVNAIWLRQNGLLNSFLIKRCFFSWNVLFHVEYECWLAYGTIHLLSKLKQL